MNHSSQPHVVNYGRISPETGALSFRLARSCTRGEECFLSYGHLPNLNLLLYYGFALEDNPNDSVPLTLSVRRYLHLSGAKEMQAMAPKIIHHADEPATTANLHTNHGINAEAAAGYFS